MRSYALIALAVVGCSSHTPGGEPEPDPKGWTITVDESGLDRFVQPQTTMPWRVAGVATATEGLVGVDVAGAPVAFGADGSFEAMVPVMPGLTPVPILAHDAAEHTRKGDRTLMAARFLPDGAHNPMAASIVLDDAILASMSGGLAAQAGTVDIAAEILARPVLSQDDQCTTWPVQASQGEVAVTLVQDRGALWLHTQIPQLYVYFEGECQGPLRTIPLAGEFGGTVDIWSQLTPKPGEPGTCLTAFGHTTPEVSVLGWGFDVWGTGGPLQAWIVSMFRDQKSAEARTQIAGEVTTRADELLTTKLANISVFDRTSEIPLLGQPVTMHLCLGSLEKVGTKLVAHVAGMASGAGERVAPGTPQIDGDAPAVAAKELLLDANLVGQLLFASWRAGGLTRPAPDADISVLQILVPELEAAYPDAIAQVMIDAELPPLVHATPDGAGKLKVELGDLMVDISSGGKRLFRFGVVLTLTLDLAPVDGKLVPSVVDTSARVALLDELYDGPDEALEQAITIQIGSTASQLIGADAAIALPDLPGLGKPIAVTADPGGRFLHVKLQ